MLSKVCVVTVKVDNLKAAIDFYTNVFDFKVSKYYGEKIASLVHNEIPIVLEEEAKDKVGRNRVLLGIYSENLDRDYELLKSKGATIVFDEPKRCPPGRFIIVEDPSGNQIEVVEFSN